MATNGMDVPFTDGEDNQEREYYYKRIIRHFPDLKDHPDVIYGNNKLVYLRLINEGLIAEVPDYDPQSLNDFVDTAVENSSYTERVRLLERRDEMAPEQKNDAEIAHSISLPGSLSNTALNVQSGELLDEVGVRVFGTGAAATDTAELQAKMNTAATFGVPLVPRGDFMVNGTIAVPSSLTADFAKATVTQTKALTPLFQVESKTDVRIQNLTAHGVTSDYLNGNGVYSACAVNLAGTTSRVSVTDSTLLGFAGAGIRIAGTVSDVTVARNRIVGPGSTYITSNTYNFSGGIVVGTGAVRWSAQDNEISDYAQGIVTGDNLKDIRITGNYIHDIPGQHGLYLETIDGGVISGNVIRDTALCSMKVQIGTADVEDADAITISDNVFMNAGAQGILLTNPPGGGVRLRNIAVTGNVLRNTSGVGIDAYSCVGLIVADNILNGADLGVSLNRCTSVKVSGNMINRTARNGIHATQTDDVTVEFNRIIDPGSALNPNSEFGIQPLGVNTNMTVRGNLITDSAGKMRYGIYASNVESLPSMSITDNHVSGARDYGWRGGSSAVRAFRGNSFAGALGAMLTPPSNFTAIASPAADTAALKATVDQMRGVLQANGLTL